MSGIGVLGFLVVNLYWLCCGFAKLFRERQWARLTIALAAIGGYPLLWQVAMHRWPRPEDRSLWVGIPLALMFPMWLFFSGAFVATMSGLWESSSRAKN